MSERSNKDEISISEASESESAIICPKPKSKIPGIRDQSRLLATLEEAAEQPVYIYIYIATA